MLVFFTLLGLFSIPLIEFLCLHEFKICLLTIHGFGNLCSVSCSSRSLVARAPSPGVGDASPKSMISSRCLAFHAPLAAPHASQPLITLLLPSGLDLLRAFEYGATVTDLGLHGGALGGTYLDARGGGLPSGVCGAGGGGGAPGGGGPGGGVPWRRPLGGSDGYVSCPQCQKPITSYNLNRHVRMVHSNMEHATCPVCSKEFKNKYSLATHMHRQHSDPGGASGQPRTTTC